LKDIRIYSILLLPQKDLTLLMLKTGLKSPKIAFVMCRFSHSPSPHHTPALPSHSSTPIASLSFQSLSFRHSHSILPITLITSYILFKGGRAALDYYNGSFASALRTVYGFDIDDSLFIRVPSNHFLFCRFLSFP
jgi:hypothetical protein